MSRGSAKRAQTEVCHLWNLVAADTREGEVYARLLEKLERAREALGGRDSVYDVLGELFQGHALREMLMEAVLYGDDPQRKQKLDVFKRRLVGREECEPVAVAALARPAVFDDVGRELYRRSVAIAPRCHAGGGKRTRAAS